MYGRKLGSINIVLFQVFIKMKGKYQFFSVYSKFVTGYHVQIMPIFDCLVCGPDEGWTQTQSKLSSSNCLCVCEECKKLVDIKI